MIRKNILLVFGVSLLIFAGCVTTPEREAVTADSAQATAMKVADDLNNGKYTALTKSSCIPFMFESEELKSDKLIHLIWKGLSEAGYQLDSPQVKTVVPTNATTYQSFDSGWEAKTFFEEYVKDKGFMVTLAGSNGKTLFLVIAYGERKTGVMALRVVQ